MSKEAAPTKILIVDDEEEILEFLRFLVETEIQAIVVTASNGQQAIELIQSHDDLDLIICDYDMPIKNGADVFDFVERFKKKSNRFRPLFALCSAHSQDDIEEFTGKELFSTIVKPHIVQGVKTLIDKIREEPSKSIENMADDYLPVRTNLLIKFNPARSDVYVKLSENKFIKLVNESEDFSHEDYYRYIEKGVDTLYIKKQDRQSFVEQSIQTIENVFVDEKRTDVEKVLDIQDSVSEHVKSFGVSPEVNKIVKENTRLSLQIIRANPDLDQFLKHITSQKSYYAEHSLIMSAVSCAIAYEMEWKADNTFLKLTTACLLHDMALQNPSYDKYFDLNELKSDHPNITESALTRHRNHPMMGAEIVRKLAEMPPDVDKIILEHHELPDGTGYPRGLQSNHISMLGAVVICAHHITDTLYERVQLGEEPKIYECLGPQLDARGPFKKVKQALVAIREKNRPKTA